MEKLQLGLLDYNSLEDSFSSNYDIWLTIEDVIDSYFSDIVNLQGSNAIDMASEIIDKLYQSSDLLSITQDNLLKIKATEEGRLIITYLNNGNQDALHFNLEAQEGEDFFLGDKVDRIKEQTEAFHAIGPRLENNAQILSAMEAVFSQNDSEIIGYLNHDDVLLTDKLGGGLEGKNLRELQLVFRDGLMALQKLPKSMYTDEQLQDLSKQEEHYLDMIVGIGDYYEGGASYLKESEIVYDIMLDDIVSSKSPEELVDYLEDIHKKCDENDRQSSVVERQYHEFFTKIHLKIAKSLIENEAPDEALISYVEVVTGRKDYTERAVSYKDGGALNRISYNDIDDNLRSPDTANLVLFHLAQKQHGFMEKLGGAENQDIFLSSDLIKNNPYGALTSFKEDFYDLFDDTENTAGHSKDTLIFQNIFMAHLRRAGYDDILDISSGVRFEELSYSQKLKLNTLERVMTKIESGITDLENTIKNSMERVTLSGWGSYDYSYMLNEFSGLFNDVSSDYIGEISSNIETQIDNDTSSWLVKSAGDYGLSGSNAKAYDLFCDINGVGIGDISDNSVETIKFAGKFAGMIAIGMLAPMVLLPAGSTLVLSGAVAGAAGTTAGILMYKKGYDTLEEASYDLVTDYLVGALTGGLGGKFSGLMGGDLLEGAEKIRREAMTNGIDLAFLGLIPEINRNMIIEKSFSGEEYLVSLKESIKAYRNDNIREGIISGNGKNAFEQIIENNKLYTDKELYPKKYARRGRNNTNQSIRW